MHASADSMPASQTDRPRGTDGPRVDADGSITMDEGRARRPAVPIAVCFTAGIAIDRWIALPWIVWLIAGLLAAMCWSIGLSRRAEAWSVVCLLAGCVCLGGARHHQFWSVRKADDVSVFVTERPQPAVVVGRLVTEPMIRSRKKESLQSAWPQYDVSNCLVEVSELKSTDECIPASGIGWLTVTGHLLHAHVGDTVEVHCMISRPRPPGNPGEWDFREFLQRRGARCLLYANFPDAVRRLKAAEGAWLWQIPGKLRRTADYILVKFLSQRTVSVASALLLGNRTSLNDDVRTAFAESGTMHLLAISGLHVGILAGFVWLCCRLLNLSPTATSVVILVTVVGYALVTDARPSIVRATVFLIIMFAGRPSHRQASLENTVAIAALLILIWNPTDLFATGSQLSFLAIMAMIWLQSKPFRMRSARSIAEITSETRPSNWVVNQLRPLWTGLKRGYLLTFAIWLFTVPLVAARFNLVSPIGLAINVFLIPLVIAVLWMGYGLLFCGFVLPELAPLFGLGLDGGLRFLMFLTESAARFRMGHFYVPGPTPLWLTGYYAILAGSLCLRTLPRARFWSWVGLCGWVVLGLGSSLVQEKPPGLRCTFLSVGHGCAALIEFPNGKTVLYDAGSIQDGNRAQRAVQSTLWDRGISRLNAIVVSHADIDHFNGLPGLFRTVGTDSLLVAKPFLDFEQESVVELCRSASANSVPIRLLARGDLLKVDDSTSVRVLHPAKDAAWSHDNESSVVLLIEFGGRRILLTGDLEGEGLAELLATAAQDVDVMLSPHHGSRGANVPELARWAQPEWVVVSGGRRGTVARLQTTYGRETRILSTIENGAITFQIDPHGIITVTTSRAPPNVRALSDRD